MAPVSLATMLLVLGLPFAGAGTAANPDILDPEEDMRIQGGAIHIPTPEIDLRAVWVELDASTIAANFQVRDVLHRLDAEESISFSLHFSNAEYQTATFNAWGDSSGWTFWFSATRHDQTSFSATATGAIDATTDTVRIEVDRSLVTSDMHDVIASTLLGVKTPWGHESNGTAWFRDFAPNDLNGPTIPV